MPSLRSELADLRALLTIDWMAARNRWRETLHHPGRAVWQILQTVWLLAVSLLPMVLAVLKKPRPPSVSLAQVTAIYAAVVFVLLAWGFFQGLIKAVSEYAPTDFSPADAHLLFPSRIGARTIYFHVLLRGFGRNLIATVTLLLPFTSIAIAARLAISWRGFAYAVAGLFCFVLFLQAARFLCYSLNKRYQISGWLTALLWGYLVLVVGWLTAATLGSTRPTSAAWTVLGGNAVVRLPIIGWTRVLLAAPLTDAPGLALPLISLALATLAALIPAVMLATDYYEEAVIAIDRVDELKRSIQRGQYDALPARRRETTPNARPRRAGNRWVGQGPQAFLWKDLQLAAQRETGIGPLISRWLIPLAIGTAAAWALRNRPPEETLFFYGLGMFVSGSMFGLVPKGLAYELKHLYIYLLPGRARSKLFWANVWMLGQGLRRNVLLVLPTVIIGSLPPLVAVGLFLALSVVEAERLFDRVLIRILLPWDRGRNVLIQYLETLIQTAFLLPGAIVAAFAYAFTRSWVATLFAFAAGEALAIWLLLIISERLFRRVEPQDVA